VSPGESAPVRDWIPLLESVAKNAKSLLVVVDDVAEDIDEEVLRALVANVQRKAISCCVIRAGRLAGADAFLPSGPLAAQGEGIVEQLPRIDRVWVRRAATYLQISREDDSRADNIKLEKTMSRVHLIYVGGADANDQAR